MNSDSNHPMQKDDNISILVQLTALKERFAAFENQFSRLAQNLAEWSAAHQAAALKTQDLESRLKVLESKDTERKGKEWDVFKLLLPHLVTWAGIGLYVYFSSKAK